MWYVTRWRQIFFLSMVSLGLAGCGFSLVKPLKLTATLQNIAIVSGNRYTDFQTELTQGLEAAGAHLEQRQVLSNSAVKSDAHQANTVREPLTIEIVQDVSGQNVLSVSATNTPTEFEVYYTVKFRVMHDTTEILPVTEFTLRREYSYSVTATLAKQHERDTIRQALAHEIAALVIRRVAALNY